MKIQALLKKTEMMNSDRQVSSRDTTADTNMHQTLVYSPLLGATNGLICKILISTLTGNSTRPVWSLEIIHPISH